MHRAGSEFDHLRQLREQLQWDRASALMEWRALAAEEDYAVHAGAHLRAGRLSGLKTEVALRLAARIAR